MHKFLLALEIIVSAVIASVLVGIHSQAAERLQDLGEKTVIVIDPGHGGENRGTTENGHEEKYMTMITALAMYEELLLYDDVEVYLTRTEDIDMYLEERAQFAKSVDADFLFSIHYNASENHELYGSEVWVSAFSPYNGFGFQYGYEFLTDMRQQGLLIRGVKTRLGDKGLDYYGIIRHCVERDIPAVIIEHCHVDEAHDEGYCDDEEKLREFGRADAAAAARYFGLKSSVLNVDYSDYQLAESSASSNVPVTQIDSTKPDICELRFLDADYEEGRLSLEVAGADYDSVLLYYSYSLDGGETFSSREAWPECDTLTGSYARQFTLDLEIESGTKPEVVVRAYNLYDLFTESEPYISPREFFAAPPLLADGAEAEAAVEQSGAARPEAAEMDILPVDAAGINKDEDNTEFDIAALLEILLGVGSVMCVLLLVIQCMIYHNRRKRRRQ